MAMLKYEVSVPHIKERSTGAKVGAATVDELAAAIYASFHGKCRCAAHPFEWDDNVDFHGWLPWTDNENTDDMVVKAFRTAAIAAAEALKAEGVRGAR
jgi:hypothetical protein